VLHRVSLRIVTMPIQSQGIITRDNVSVDVSAVAYFRVVDAVKSVVAIENVRAAIDQIAQTTLRKVVGQHSLDQTLSETDQINLDIRRIGAAAAESAEPGRDRRRQEHHRRVPRPADEHHRGTRRLPRPREGGCGPGASTAQRRARPRAGTRRSHTGGIAASGA
jgi:hypothetical protein